MVSPAQHLRRHAFALALTATLGACDSGPDEVADTRSDTAESSDTLAPEDSAAPDTVPTDDTITMPDTAGDDVVPGPTPEELPGTVGVRAIGLALDHVYFVTDTMIGRIPKAGGAVETLHSLSNSAPNDLAVNDTWVAWTERFASLVAGAVRRCPAIGCGQGPTTIPNPGESTGVIAMQGDRVVWIAGSENKVYSNFGWGFSRGPTGTMLADVAIDGDDIFVLDGGLRLAGKAGAVLRCSANVSPCTPTTLSEAVDSPSHIVVAGPDVLVLSDKALYRMDRDGGHLTTLAPVTFHGFTSLASDGVDVYWAIAGELFGCAIANCVPRSIATTQGAMEWTRDLAVDATHVFWSTGRLWRIAR